MEASVGGRGLPGHRTEVVMALQYCKYHDEWYDEDIQEACPQCVREAWVGEIVEVEDRRAQV